MRRISGLTACPYTLLGTAMRGVILNPNLHGMISHAIKIGNYDQVRLLVEKNSGYLSLEQSVEFFCRLQARQKNLKNVDESNALSECIASVAAVRERKSSSGPSSWI